jgi:hypothetical protein
VIVNLHIERLVLDGLPVGRHEGPLIRAAVEAELTRQLGAEGAAARLAVGHGAPLVRTEPIDSAAGGPQRLGAGIGRAVFEGITR